MLWRDVRKVEVTHRQNLFRFFAEPVKVVERSIYLRGNVMAHNGNASNAIGLAVLLCSLFPSMCCIAMTPGGIASGNANASGKPTATQFSSTIRIDVDPGRVDYFWAQQFALNTTADHGGYFGIQANGNINGHDVGRMLIFSIWNAVRAKPASGAVAQRFDGEGKGYSIRLAYPWRAGVSYTFHLARENKTGWHAMVHASNNPDIDLGTIEIDKEATLQTGFINFTEYFGNLPSCAALPAAKVTFSDLIYGTTLVPFDSVDSSGGCPDYVMTNLPTPRSNSHVINATSTRPSRRDHDQP